jgi:membrane-associated protein
VLTAVLETAAGWPVPAVLTVACVLLVVESGTLVGMAVPGTTLLVALGLWSHTAPQALAPAIVAAAAATVTGAHLGWWRGRAAPAWAGDTRRIAARAAQARSWLADRGPLATAALLACGHWAAAARPIMPRIAGAAAVPYRTAGPVLALSGSAWATTLVLLGNRMGPVVLTSAAWAPIVLVALLVGALVVRSRRTRADDSPLTGASSPLHAPAPAWACDLDPHRPGVACCHRPAARPGCR